MEEEKFRFLEHTADAYIEAYGKTVEEAFENAALAMFEVMTDTKQITEEVKDEVVIEADDQNMLLHDLLAALLLKFETESKLYSRFRIKPIREVNGKLLLEAEVYGEYFQLGKHPSKTEVKAVTYHKMKIEQKDGKVMVQYILDL